MSQLRGAVDPDAIQATIDWLDRLAKTDLADPPPVIAVVGAFSRGKSALINTLIDLPILPVNPLPTTPLPTWLSYAESLTAALIFPDYDQPLTGDALTRLTLFQGDTKTFDGALGLRIGCPSPLLAAGLVLLDSPGIDAPGAEPFVLADDVAALIGVFAADPPLSAEEIAYFGTLIEQMPSVYWVQTKADLLSETDLQAATQYNRTALQEAFGNLGESFTTVSVYNGVGLVALKQQLTARAAAEWQTLRRDSHRLLSRAKVRSLRVTLQEQAQHFDIIRGLLEMLEWQFDHDLEDIRAGMLATLAHLSEYVLGNLSAPMYRTDPAALSGATGIALTDAELRHTRDMLANEVERALLLVRQSIIDDYDGRLAPIAPFPLVPHLVLPDPQRGTVGVQVTAARRLRPKQIQPQQTINAYRTAVAHRCDNYAAELAPVLEAALDQWQAQAAGWFTDQRAEVRGPSAQIETWLALLAQWS